MSTVIDRREYKRLTASLYRQGMQLTVDAEPYRTWAREAWRSLTLGEMSLLTGLPVPTLHKAMWGSNPRMRLRTAAAITTLRMMLAQERGDA